MPLPWKIVVFVAVLGVLFHVFTPKERPVTSAGPTTGQLKRAIAGLFASEAPDAFLVVYIRGTSDFLQFTAGPGTVQLDFPVITERQRELRQRVQEVCRSLGLAQTVNQGSDGSEFLDCDISGSVESVVAVIRQVIDGVFGSSADEDLLFDANGFVLGDA